LKPGLPGNLKNLNFLKPCSEIQCYLISSSTVSTGASLDVVLRGAQQCQQTLSQAGNIMMIMYNAPLDG
jgi:hypothetical protein